MVLFYPDVECIPLQRPDAMERIRSKLAPPGNYKKPEAIDKWWTESAPAEAEEKYLKWSLNPWLSELVTIGWALNDNPVVVHQREPGQPEVELLREFFIELHTQLNDANGQLRRITKWIGSNPLFDVRAIAAACVRNRFQPFLLLPIHAKPWSENIVDIAMVVGDTQTRTGMDDLCYALGIEGKGDFSGADVYPAWLDGETAKIAAYCGEDVERGRQIYKRLKVLGV